MKSPPDDAPGILHGLIRLYPPALREEYGEEMHALVSKHYRRALEEGRGTRYVAGTALSLAGNAILARFELALRAPAYSLDRRSVRRSLGRAPGFAGAVVLVIAVAVAVVTATAGFLRGTLYGAPRYPEPERLVFAWGSNVRNGQMRDVVSGPNFLDLRRSTRTLETLAAVHPESAVVTRKGRPEVVDALEVSVDFLRVLRATPRLGSDFVEEHRTSSGPDGVILSHGFWRDHLGADPRAIGSALLLDGSPHTVVGVLGPDFDFLTPAPVLLPLREDDLAREDRTFHNYWLLGRLSPRATAGEASRELSEELERIAREDPRLSGWSVLVERVDEISPAAVRPLLIAIGAAVLLVLAAASANLANLNLVRTISRSRDTFVRLALGARRFDVARLVILETGTLAAGGAALGLAGGAALLHSLAGVVPAFIPIPGSAATVRALLGALDVEVLLAGLGAAGLAWGFLVLPSLLYLLERREHGTASGDGTRVVRGAPRVARFVAAVELALATVLLVGAGLLTRASDRLLAVDLGVDPEGLLTLYAGELETANAGDRARYFLEVVRRLEDLPVVERAGACDYVPFQGEDDFMGFRLEDRPPPPPGQGLREEWRRVSEGYFEAAGLEMRRGRGLEPRDFVVPPAVAVVNESFARRYWSDVDPVGQRMRIARSEYGLVEVVGVVEDVPERGPALPPPPTFFVPLHGLPRDNMALFVKVQGDPMSALETVRETVWAVDSAQPIDRVFPMAALVSHAVALPRLARTLVAQFAFLTLSLALFGLFALVSYSVRSRRPELGLRLALGATPLRLKWDLLAEAAPFGALAVLAGSALGVGAGHVGRALLHGVSPEDPGAVATALLVISAGSLFAIYLSAGAVARIDPAESVRRV